MYLCNRFRIDIPAVSIIVLTMSRKSASLAKNTAASILAAIALLAFPFRAAAADGDLNSEAIDTTALTGNWVSQLIKTGFHINDPRINYPAFPRFALKVYNWGDRTFNHYESAFVESTGKNWKLQMKNEMWMRTYIMQLADHSTIHITSRLYDDLGIHLSFMAVSVGYSFNLNSFMGDDTQD